MSATDDQLWEETCALLRSEGKDPDKMLCRAAENLRHLHDVDLLPPSETELDALVEWVLWGGPP